MRFGLFSNREASGRSVQEGWTEIESNRLQVLLVSVWFWSTKKLGNARLVLAVVGKGDAPFWRVKCRDQ